VITTFKRLKFDSYAPTYNPTWSKYPNFSWISQYALMPNAQGGGF